MFYLGIRACLMSDVHKAVRAPHKYITDDCHDMNANTGGRLKTKMILKCDSNVLVNRLLEKCV